ncbi:IS66-like element accessory protein TnpA [Methyloraptor flagellatus]|uniref:Transposase n=1 Tax=Methyloraptor flagellatus TaxID=3162530 RepID=A0AAU7XCY8_9HYPH
MASAKVISEFEVLSAADVGRRRVWTAEDKVRIVEESLAGWRQGSATARRLGISRSLLTRWRADYRAGRLGPLVPTFMAVTTAEAAASVLAPLPVQERPTPQAVAPPMAETTVEIVLCNGRRMIVPVTVDPAVLSRLVMAVDAP